MSAHADALLALLAARRGHFRMESGYHSREWYELDRLFAAAAAIAPFVRSLAESLRAHEPEMVCGPERGGAILARMLASELGCPALATQRQEPVTRPAADRLFPVEYFLAPADIDRARGRRVAVVDDAISAGSAIRGSLASLEAAEAIPVALGALIVFGDAAAGFAAGHGLPLETVARAGFSLWRPDACPLCVAGVPLEAVSDAAQQP